MSDALFRIAFAILLIIGGLGYCGMQVLARAMGDPNSGFLNGFGPLLVGFGAAVAGGLLIII